MLDLLLVNPGNSAKMYQTLASLLRGIEPPFWAGLLASFIRNHGYSVMILDADAENWSPQYTSEKIAEYNPLLTDIIVLGSNPSASSTPKMTAAGELASALKKQAPHLKTIFSGLHPSALPAQTLREEDIDFVCQGEGFHTILQLLEVLKSDKGPSGYKIPGLWYLQNGEVIANPPPPLVNPDELPLVAWDLLPMDKYRAHNWQCFDNIDKRQPYAVTYTSLGCPFHCNYCNIHALYNDKPGIRFRSPEKVVEEIDLLVNKYGVRHLKIMDELFTMSEKQVASICDPIIERGYDLNIWAYARIDRVTKPMLVKMKQAGINWVGYGIEAGSERVRRGMGKKFDQDRISQVVEMTREAGIYINANFIFGLPDDDLESMQATLDMMKEYNFEYVNLYCTMAYPGSQLYEDAVRQGIKLPEEWYAYGQYTEETLPLPTKHLSAAEVLRFRDNAFREYFSNPKYLEMIREKFGSKVVEHIKDMLKHEIHRKYI